MALTVYLEPRHSGLRSGPSHNNGKGRWSKTQKKKKRMKTKMKKWRKQAVAADIVGDGDPAAAQDAPSFVDIDASQIA